MNNCFFGSSSDSDYIKERLISLDHGRVGFYSIGLYPASLAYNCAMQNRSTKLLIAVRQGRELLGAFNSTSLEGMDSDHVESLKEMAYHREGDQIVKNNLSDLILRCDLVILW